MWSDHLYNFYLSLKPPAKLPNGVQWLYPQKDPSVQEVLRIFLHQYYNDDRPRHLLLGINPGRYGAGVTGVNFTAPKQLTENLHIPHAFKMQSELSAEFMYAMIDAYGGPEKFYGDHFISSVCPFGFVQNGKNINYYDDKELLVKVLPFITTSMQELLKGNFDRSRCWCIGGEKNYKHFSALNDRHQWFKEVVALPHPRFIMQYKRKQLADYIALYVEKLKI